MNKLWIAWAAGFAAGILLAPHKGSVTRRKLRESFDDISDKVDTLIDKFTPEQNKEAIQSSVPRMSDAV